MRIRISPFAEKDLQESIEFYNKQKEGLGDDFADVIDYTIERIKENPNQFSAEYKEIKKAQIKRFPFNIFFVVEDSTCYILGVFHTSRNPDIMNDRYPLK